MADYCGKVAKSADAVTFLPIITCTIQATVQHVICTFLKKRKMNDTHPKSQQQKVSALQTHLYPSRCENPVGLWMKPQLQQLRGNVHLKRTIIKNHPKCASPSSVMLSWVKGELVKDLQRRGKKSQEKKTHTHTEREKKCDPRASVMCGCPCAAQPPLCAGRSQSSGPSLSCILCGRRGEQEESSDTGLCSLRNCARQI